MDTHPIRNPHLLDGLAVSLNLKKILQQRAEDLREQNNITPGLAVVRVGDDPASEVYVQHKRRVAQDLGFLFQEHAFPSSVSYADLLLCLGSLEQNPAIHGIIVQLPLPEGWVPSTLLHHIPPSKDVDGLHPLNRGILFSDEEPLFVPCTPWGCLFLLDTYGLSLQGKEAVVVGRSLLVGRPLVALLIRRGATVTLAHSQTPNLAAVTRRADFLFVATGSPHLIGPDHVKEGVVIVDVGISRQGDHLVGDVDFDAVRSQVAAITPVPGGVGPLTVMGLMHNTLLAAYRSEGMAFSL